jgi:hypothetical protein
METNRLRTGELIAGVAGIALFIIMFLPWFGLDADVPAGAEEAAESVGFALPDVDLSVNAFEAFDFIDLVLIVTVVVAVGLAVAALMAQTVALPVAASALTAGLGILSTLLVLYRIIDTPAGLDREFWVFLGLIAAAAIAYGGWRAMQEEGTSFAGEADRIGDRFSDRPTDAGGAPPPRPAPGDPGAPPPPSSAPPPGGAPRP